MERLGETIKHAVINDVILSLSNCCEQEVLNSGHCGDAVSQHYAKLGATEGASLKTKSGPQKKANFPKDSTTIGIIVSPAASLMPVLLPGSTNKTVG